MAGSLSARYPHIKNSIYESAEMEMIEFVISVICFYASSYPFWYYISLKTSFKNMNKIKQPNRNRIIRDGVVRLTNALLLL